MAVINDPSTGDDVINDTTGNDVINLIGGRDVINLSGGNDIINTAPVSNNMSNQADIRLNDVTMQGLTVNGGETVVSATASSQIGKLTLNNFAGSMLNATNARIENGYANSQLAYSVDDGSLYFFGKADSLQVDLRHYNNANTGLDVDIGGEIQQLSIDYGANGGKSWISPTMGGGHSSIQLKAWDAAATTPDNKNSINTIISSHSSEAATEFNIDYSVTNQKADTIITGFNVDIPKLNYIGSHGGNDLTVFTNTQNAVVKTFEGNDSVSLWLSDNGSATIDLQGGDNYLQIAGGSATYQSGSGRDILYVNGTAASIQTGGGADYVASDLPLYRQGSANQTIDLGASGVAQTGNVSVRINGYASLVNGVGAHASVYAGGKKIGEIQANNTATTGQDFFITTAAANLTNGEFAIVFDNDAYVAATSTAPAQDRNLYVREVEMIEPNGTHWMLWNKDNSTNPYAERPTYDQYNSGAPAGVNSAFDGQNLRTYTPSSAGTISMAWGGALKFNVHTQVAGIDIADGGNGSDTYLFDRNSGRDLYRDTGTQAGDVDVLKFSADVKVDQIWLSRDAQAKIHVGIIGTNNDAVINGIDQLQAGGKTLAAADFDKLVTAMASVTPPPMGQTTLTADQHAKLDAVLAANWH